MMLELLKSKFGDCKFLAVSDCMGSYETTNAAAFCIYDPPNEQNKPVRIVNVNDDYQLNVLNTDNLEVCLVKTDKCLFADLSKCDCLLFSNKKFFFIEIKSSSSGTRKDKRYAAVGQLDATIKNLNDNGFSLDDYDAKAIICFKHENKYPIQVSRNTRRAEFFEKYKVSLEEGNTIEF